MLARKCMKYNPIQSADGSVKAGTPSAYCHHLSLYAFRFALKRPSFTRDSTISKHSGKSDATGPL